MKVQRTAAAYFGLQGIAVFVWWALLYLEPSTRQYFALETNSNTSLFAFWLADLAFIGTGSIVVAVACVADSTIKTIAAWFVTGCMSYAAVYVFAFALLTDNGWLGVVLMFPAMIWCGGFSVGITFSRQMVRPAAGAPPGWIMFKTFGQILIVWSIILVLFPFLITVVEDKLGIVRLSFPMQETMMAFLFLAISSIGVWAAYVMSRTGGGTPLPLDHANKLVIKGPYAFVRNPMALSGIGQGLAVALFLGSPLVAIYSLMGSFIWKLIFRPLEEEDLARRFGDPHLKYKRSVKCWIPRFPGYSPSSEGGKDR